MVKKDKYRRTGLTDFRGMKNAIAEMKGIGFPKQPKLNSNYIPKDDDPLLDENYFTKLIKEKLSNHPDNKMEGPKLFGQKIFEDPIIGFVSGDDPILEEYKTIIGPHHFTPYEMMKWQAENNGVEPPKKEDISVICIIMSIVKETKDGNAIQTEMPTERWAQTRLLGEIFSQNYIREIVTDLMNKGVLAVAPDSTPMFNKKIYPKVGWASPFSLRHMCYAAGLGTFGLQDFLITEKGVAHRCAAFVVNLKLKPNRKRPDDIHAHCLHYQGFKCMKCASRCPVNAIDKDGHDKNMCKKKVQKTVPYVVKNYKIFIYGCGLCACGTPCESGIPKQLQ